jgi:hypothetical protein
VLDILGDQRGRSTPFLLVLQDAQVEVHSLVEDLDEVLIILFHVVSSVRVQAAFAHLLVDFLAAGLEQTTLIHAYSPNKV